MYHLAKTAKKGTWRVMTSIIKPFFQCLSHIYIYLRQNQWTDDKALINITFPPLRRNRICPKHSSAKQIEFRTGQATPICMTQRLLGSHTAKTQRALIHYMRNFPLQLILCGLRNTKTSELLCTTIVNIISLMHAWIMFGTLPETMR